MGTVRQTVVQPLGLINTPNTYGQYPAGALSVAQNIVMRAPGEVWQSPGFGTQVATFGAASDVLRKAFPLDAGKVFAWTRTGAGVWTVSESGNAAALPSIANTTNLFSNTGQITPVRMRERMLSNTATCGVFVSDSMNPTVAADRTQRSAGMPQPIMTIGVTTTNAGTIPSAISVGYALLLKRVFSDGYEVVSVPSPVQTIYNTTGGLMDPLITAKWPVNGGVLENDVVEFYRTDGLAGGTAESDPGETLKLVGIRKLTAADIIAGSYVLRDVAVIQAPLYYTSGRELYTNPGQETSLQANRQPNICTTMAPFKGFLFNGNITERPSWTFSVPGGTGDTAIAAQDTVYFRTNGIGSRRGVSTITAGSAVITAVSATQILGVKIGQRWRGSTLIWPTGTAVINVGVNTITMASNALINQTDWALADVVQIDGVDITFNSLAGFVTAFAVTPAPYELTVDTSINLSTSFVTNFTFTVEPSRPQQSTITVRATNGANYREPIPEFTATVATFSRKTTPNLLQWSKDSEPEHVPPSNETTVGAGTILSMSATKNALWIFCTDGLYRLSGDAPPWRLDLVDPSCIIVAPQALTQLRDTVFAYTNYGIAAITDVGIAEVTSQLLQETFPGPAYSATPTVILERNELDDEIVVSLGTNILYVFNTKQKAWTYLSATPSSTTADITALAFQRTPASGAAVLLVGTSTSGQVPRYAPWNPGGVNFLAGDTRYQPFYGDDPLTMKQFIDETLLFNPADAGKTATVSETGVTIASTPLTLHNSDAYGTVGVPRRFAISQSAAPGFTMLSSATQFKFRGISLRFAPANNQAWRT